MAASELVPDGAAVSLSLPWTYTVDPAAAASHELGGAAQISWHWDCADPWIDVRGPRTTNLALTVDRTTYSGEHRVNATAGWNAPGETQVPCTFEAEVRNGPPNLEPEPDTVVVPLRVAYQPEVGMRWTQPVWEVAPGNETVVNLLLTNYGNARTEVVVQATLDAIGGGTSPEAVGWSVASPAPVILGSEAQGATDTNATVEVRVRAPDGTGWINDSIIVDIVATPRSTMDPSLEGTPVRVNALVEVRGLGHGDREEDKDAPMALPVLALLGAVLLATRRRA